MNKGDTRLTLQEIKKFKRLYKKGWSSNQIGEKFQRNHTTILFHLGKLKRKPGRKPSSKKVKPPKTEIPAKAEIPEEIKNNIEAEQNKIKNAIIEKEKRKEVGNCIVCGKKIRNIKFKKTRFCSLKCF